MLYRHHPISYEEAKTIMKFLQERGIKFHYTKDEEGRPLFLADLPSELIVVRFSIKDKNGIECDYHFGKVIEGESDYGFYDLPFTSSDFPLTAVYLFSPGYVELTGMKKADQLKIFGFYFGRMRITVDFLKQTVVASISVCFGTDREIVKVCNFSEFTKQVC